MKNEIIERSGFGYEKPDVEIDEIQKFAENHGKYKNVVKEVIEGYDKASNNDFILFIEVLKWLDLIKITYGKEDVIIRFKYGDVPYIPSPESITRARRTLNSVGLCLPTSKAVFLRRMRRQVGIKLFFSGKFK